MEYDLVRERSELKYILAVEDAEEILRRVPPGERRDARVTTVYFDRPDGALAREALASPQANLKIRLREYLTPVGEACSPFIWIEVKRREGRTSTKRRFELHKRLVSSFLRGRISEGAILTCQGPFTESDDAVEALEQIREVAGGTLVPLGVVSYRRTALQAQQARLTVDRDISYHLGPQHLYEAHPSLGLPALGGSAWDEPRAVVEIKFKGAEPPRWCLAALAGFQAQDYSKFVVLARLAFSEAPVA